MALPKVAIIGRPNVGKSSLLNALAGEMISIVEPTAGVTRDRISTLIENDGRYVELYDTGGYGIVDSDQLNEHVENQILKAIDSSNLIIFMVDIRDGVTTLDKKIAEMLRKKDLSVIGVANKADSASMFPAAAEFCKLGFGEFLCISATNNLNKSVLIERIFEKFADLEAGAPPEPVMKIAIVGKRNTGKSTIVNAIAGEDRVIVSDIPGTTRDAVDVRVEKDGRTIVVIDTAGVRKKTKFENDIEFYGYVRASKSITRADVIFFMIDATAPISHVDKKLALAIFTEYKSCIIIVNKWDLALQAGASTEDFEKYLTRVLPGLRYAPIAFTTATESKNIQSVIDLASVIFKKATTWIPTPKLNKALEIIKAERVGATKHSKTGWPKIYYGTQVAINPVTILLFVNRPELFEENYLRFIVGRLQSMLPIDEVPLRLLVRPHRKDEETESDK